MKNPKYFLLLALFIQTCAAAVAQQTTHKGSARFQSINLIGLLEGEKGSAFQLQTVNGVFYRSWFAGIGVGLDYYRIRSLPLFLDLRKNFASGRNSFFLYADGGIHFPWPTDGQKNFTGSTFTNGFYGDFGAGYQLNLHGSNALLLSLGYSYKTTEEKSSLNICPFYGPCFPNPQRLAYDLSRISIKVGLAL